jgi:EmrB/QacA subfamily drug resistance transporter
MSTTTTLAENEVSTTPQQRVWIQVATSLALLAVMASVTGLNAAQQAIVADLGASQTELLWIINGFTIALAATLLPLGALGDRIGRKPILIAGVTGFAVLHVAATFATNAETLIALRIAMGVAAALIMPATLATITSAFPAEERGRAVGVWTGVAGGGGVIGLLASALVVDNAAWEWVFAIPVVIAVVAATITIPKVPNTREGRSHGRFDYLGALLSVLAVGGIVMAIHEGPEQGWTAPITLGAAALGLIALASFVRQELRTAEPLLDVRVFTNRTLSAGALSLTVMFALLFGMFLVLIQFLQAILGFGAVESAIALLPMMVGMTVVSVVAAGISERFGYRRTMTVSLAGIGVALGWFALVSDNPSYLDIAPAMALFGLSLGIAMTPSTTAITESLPADKQGVASALNDIVREFGGAIGVALIGSVLAAGYRSSIADTASTLPDGLEHGVQEGIGGAYVAADALGTDGGSLIDAAQQAFLDGWSTAMWIAAGVALLAAVAAAAIIPGRETPDDTDENGDDDLLASAAEVVGANR